MNVECYFYIKYINFVLNLTLKSEDNNIIAVIGESGSGKTTLLKCIAGIINPNKGYLKINNYLFQDDQKKIFIKTCERKIGYVFQNNILFSNMNVIENINISEKKNFKTININKNEVIKILNLEKLKYRKIFNLSGGEKQRICIAQIILMQPNLILLDEPFSSQDKNMKEKLIIFFKYINKKFNIPIIYVSHEINDIYKFTNKIYYLNKGKIFNRINL